MAAALIDSANRFTARWLTKVVQTYLSRIFPAESVVHNSFEWSPRDRTVFAMILVLFSVGDI
jgi:hypothetical protein